MRPLSSPRAFSWVSASWVSAPMDASLSMHVMHQRKGLACCGLIVKVVAMQAVAGPKGEVHLIGEAIGVRDFLAHHVTDFRGREINQQRTAAAESHRRIILWPEALRNLDDKVGADVAFGPDA